MNRLALTAAIALALSATPVFAWDDEECADWLKTHPSPHPDCVQATPTPQPATATPRPPTATPPPPTATATRAAPTATATVSQECIPCDEGEGEHHATPTPTAVPVEPAPTVVGTPMATPNNQPTATPVVDTIAGAQPPVEDSSIPTSTPTQMAGIAASAVTEVAPAATQVLGSVVSPNVLPRTGTPISLVVTSLSGLVLLAIGYVVRRLS